MPTKKQTLRKVFLFDHLRPDAVAGVDGRCSWLNVDANETFVHNGDSSHDVFFLVAGKARVLVYSSAGKLMPLRALAAGDFFGEMSALDGLPRSASVEAVSKSLVARMTSKDFRSLLAEDPELNRKLMGHFVTQIRALTGRVYELGTFDLGSRISAEVLRLARDGNGSSQDDQVIRIPSKTQLAHQLGASREAVSREIKRLVKLGVLATDNGYEYRYDGERLRDLIDGRSPKKT